MPLASLPVPLVNLVLVISQLTCSSLGNALLVSLTVPSTKFYENNDQACLKSFHLYLVYLHTEKKKRQGFLVNS